MVLALHFSVSRFMRSCLFPQCRRYRHPGAQQGSMRLTHQLAAQDEVLALEDRLDLSQIVDGGQIN